MGFAEPLKDGEGTATCQIRTVGRCEAKECDDVKFKCVGGVGRQKTVRRTLVNGPSVCRRRKDPGTIFLKVAVSLPDTALDRRVYGQPLVHPVSPLARSLLDLYTSTPTLTCLADFCCAGDSTHTAVSISTSQRPPSEPQRPLYPPTSLRSSSSLSSLLLVSFS